MATKKQRLAREDIRRAAKKIQAEGNLVTRGTLKDEKITVRDIKREIPEGLTKKAKK